MSEDNIQVRRKRFGVSIDQLWIIGVLAIFTLLVSLMPVFPNDFWWHLKIGEIIYQTKTIPKTNLFAWTLSPDYPYVYGAWFGELLLYIIYQLGKVSLLIFIRTVLTIAAFILIGYEAKRRSGSWRIAGFVLLFACAMSTNNTIVRPQFWAWIPFAIFYIFLSRFVDGQLNPKWLLLFPLIMAFWVNAHGSFILGIVLLGIFFVGEGIRKLLKMSGAMEWQGLGWIALSGALTFLATLINPRFVSIYFYVNKLMTDKSVQKLTIEWQSPTPHDYASIIFYISILIMIGFLVYSPRRLTPTELLLIVSFLWLAWGGVRYVVWFGMVGMTVLAGPIRACIKKPSWLAVPPKNTLNLVIAIILVIPAIIAQPWIISKIPLPKGYAKFVINDPKIGPLLYKYTPIGAAEYLKQNPGGKLFNEMSFGSYLIWYVPEQGVFADTRTELYSYDFWMDYIKINDGIRSMELLDKYGANRVLLNPTEDEELLYLLGKNSSWKLEYSDDVSQIWIKQK